MRERRVNYSQQVSKLCGQLSTDNSEQRDQLLQSPTVRGVPGELNEQQGVGGKEAREVTGEEEARLQRPL